MFLTKLQLEKLQSLAANQLPSITDKTLVEICHLPNDIGWHLTIRAIFFLPKREIKEFRWDYTKKSWELFDGKTKKS